MSNVNYRMIEDRILVRKATSTRETSKGGIVLPETTRDELIVRGEVLATGPGRLDANGYLAPVRVNAGEVVLFSRHSGTKMPGDDDLLVLRFGDVLAIEELRVEKALTAATTLEDLEQLEQAADAETIAAFDRHFEATTDNFRRPPKPTTMPGDGEKFE